MLHSRVAVLYGGSSNEREVSLRSGKAVFDALLRKGYTNTVLIDIVDDFLPEIIKNKIDLAFIAMQGGYGEDGCLQGLLECLKIPYTHSSVAATALSMDKYASYLIFRSVGIPCPESILVTPQSNTISGSLMPYSYVLKPVDDGSSVGITLVKSGSADIEIDAAFIGKRMMASRYIEGLELTVAVIEDTPFEVLEVKNVNGLFRYDDKYGLDRSTRYVCPAEIPGHIANQIKEYALLAHKILGCSGVTRTDFRYNPATEEIAVLELNSNPGMTSTSMLPVIAQNAGIGFDDLVVKILSHATLHNMRSTNNNATVL